MDVNLFREERLRLIMEMINEKKKVFVKELANEFGKSSSSIRLDLAELESRRLINRTHGGAILADMGNNTYVVDKKILYQREETSKAEKQRIGKAVIELISDGDSIMIDGGSTTYYVAHTLNKKRGLTIITTSFYLLPVLLEISDAKIYLTGGLIHRDFKALIGDISIDSIQRFKPDCVIMGIDGMSIKNGLTSTEASMKQIKKQMKSVGEKTIVVADSTKIGKVCPQHVLDINDVYAVVTDTGASQEFIQSFSRFDTKLILA